MQGATCQGHSREGLHPGLVELRGPLPLLVSAATEKGVLKAAACGCTSALLLASHSGDSVGDLSSAELPLPI